MSTLAKIQAGAKTESTYGTAVVCDRFWEITKDSVQARHGRIQSNGMASGRRVRSSARGGVYTQGADGTVEMEILTKGFGWWLAHMLGGSATSGPTDSKYTHTGTIGTLLGKMFTYQSNRPFASADTDQPYTFEGGKIKSWEIAQEAEGLLMFSADLDFEDYKTATGLASASYPAGAENFHFAQCAITLAGSAFNVKGFKVGLDNKLNVDRRFILSAGLKKEPLENDFRELSWSVTDRDFDDLTEFNLFKSATLAGTMATIVATWTCPTLIGASSTPTLVLTIDNAQFETWESTIDGPGTLVQQVGGTGLFDGTDSAITIAYGSADATA